MHIVKLSRAGRKGPKCLQSQARMGPLYQTSAEEYRNLAENDTGNFLFRMFIYFLCMYFNVCILGVLCYVGCKLGEFSFRETKTIL